MQHHLPAWMPWLGSQKDAHKVLGFSDFPSDFVSCWGEYGHSNICIYKSKRGGWKQTSFPNLLSQSDTKSDAESWVDEDVVNQFKPEGKSPLWKFSWLLEAFWEACTNIQRQESLNKSSFLSCAFYFLHDPTTRTLWTSCKLEEGKLWWLQNICGWPESEHQRGPADEHVRRLWPNHRCSTLAAARIIWVMVRSLVVYILSTVTKLNFTQNFFLITQNIILYALRRNRARFFRRSFVQCTGINL